MAKKDNYELLLKAIKETKNNDNYKPRKYEFGLKSFDEKGQKKRVN